MTHLLQRALPFVVTFVFGVAIATIVANFVPTRRMTFHDRTDRCKWKTKINRDADSVGHTKTASTVVYVNEIHNSEKATQISLRLQDSNSDAFTLKEQALLRRSAPVWDRSRPSFVVSYVSPEAIDGRPVTSDASLHLIPRPDFWREERNVWETLDCNALVRVNLDSSGKVTEAKKVSGYADACPYTDDILNAAKQISFRPAFRDGVPVSQRISIMYRLH